LFVFRSIHFVTTTSFLVLVLVGCFMFVKTVYILLSLQVESNDILLFCTIFVLLIIRGEILLKYIQIISGVDFYTTILDE
jgi:hypothetical protein